MPHRLRVVPHRLLHVLLGGQLHQRLALGPPVHADQYVDALGAPQEVAARKEPDDVVPGRVVRQAPRPHDVVAIVCLFKNT